MNRENLAFLVGGFAFGLLFGFGLFNAVEKAPEPGTGAAQQAQAPSPAGPRAPTQVGPGGEPGGAPMMAEINSLKRKLQETPDDVVALGRMANIYHDVAMWDQAIEYYERALEVEPASPDLLTDLGVCYRGSKQFDRALELFERAHGLDSAHWQSLFNTVVVAGFDLGQFDRARAALESMERMEPQPPRLADLRQAIERAETQAQGEDRS